MVEINVSSSISPYLDGEETITVEAATIRDLFNRLEELYPDFTPLLHDGVAVAIDGVIFRDTWSTPLPRDAEIFLLPRLAGG